VRWRCGRNGVDGVRQLCDGTAAWIPLRYIQSNTIVLK
jgi:hypothetical protein